MASTSWRCRMLWLLGGSLAGEWFYVAETKPLKIVHIKGHQNSQVMPKFSLSWRSVKEIDKRRQRNEHQGILEELSKWQQKKKGSSGMPLGHKLAYDAEEEGRDS
jgi:hypothetical protein